MTRRNYTPSVASAGACVLALALLIAHVPLAAQTVGQATNPSPPNGATNVSTSVVLTWTGGANARRYDVRFGTTPNPPVVLKNATATSYQPGTLAAATTYYWQIDSRGQKNDITVGQLWSFTTAAPAPAPPAAPASPSPATGAVDVATTTSLTWARSSDTTSYTVAFGTSNPPPLVSSGQAASYEPGTLEHGTLYYWQVTAQGPGGSTAGSVWSFSTAALEEPPPPPPPPPATTLERLRLMSWNIRQGRNLANALSVDAQVELMADSGAHVVVLQEVTINADGDLTVLYKSKLEALTGQTWHAVWAPAARPSTATPEGNMLLTTLPIVSSSTLQIDSAPGDPTWLDTKRSAVQAAVVVNSVAVNVIGTHLALDAKQRASQLNTLLPWLDTFAAPRVVGGDFNMVEGTATYGTMAAAFSDAWTVLADGDAGFTMDKRNSADNQPGRIDFWWQEISGSQARGTEMWVIKTSRSDHHAVLIDVLVQP